MSEYNSPEYINEVLSGQHRRPEREKLLLSITYSLRTLFFGRKWFVYVILTLIPILFGLIASEPLLGEQNPEDAYTFMMMNVVFGVLYTFGALLISLPFTADEITDNVMESYVVRPTRRDTILLSRAIVSVIGIWLINSLIALIYYLFFHIFDPNFAAANISDNIDVLIGTIYLNFFAAIVYGTIFTFVGVIGNKGFTLGILLAMVETFFISLLFLTDSPYIPKTHIDNLAAKVLDNYTYGNAPAGMTVWDNYLYFLVFGLAATIGGILYFRQKQFDG